jgi:hypothetical protein
MEFISTKWLLILACASAWTIFFSLFNNPGIRGWRNLGWLACYGIGAFMMYELTLLVALATWSLAGIFSGLVYLGYELFVYAKAGDKTGVSKPDLFVIVHGLAMWPIMLPEAIEYLLAESGILKPTEDSKL